MYVGKLQTGKSLYQFANYLFIYKKGKLYINVTIRFVKVKEFIYKHLFGVYNKIVSMFLKQLNTIHEKTIIIIVCCR